MSHAKKTISLVLASLVIAAIVAYLYPIAKDTLLKLRAHAYPYSYTPPHNLKAADVSLLPPAQAVPILMYHGVLDDRVAAAEPAKVGTNTTRAKFIAQMEMLKREGYQTISIAEYDAFREGTFTLPPKPIIITFDDARRDSFYTTDTVFKKLGFKATNFVVTGRTLADDPFFLSWDELKYMQSTGRWEIEAHGRESHDKFINGPTNTVGVFLTSRKYSPETGYEPVADFEKRVTEDYLNNINDLKEHLGIDARYFAVPLNHYGDDDQSNYPPAGILNRALVSKDFRLAFIEAGDKDNRALDTFYNYKDTEHTDIKRLEVKTMTTNDLEVALDQFSPTKPGLAYPEDPKTFTQKTELLYGVLDTSHGVTLASNNTVQSARVIFGDPEWKNYGLDTVVTREKGKSTSILIYYQDENNLISLDWGDKYAALIERIGGADRTIASYDLPKAVATATITIRIYDGMISAAFNGTTLTTGSPISITRGTSGMSVWDTAAAQSTIQKLSIAALTAAPVALPPVPVVVSSGSSTLLESQGYYDDPIIPYFSHGLKKYDWKTVGKLMILDNSNPWNDYDAEANVRLSQGDVTLVARYQDADNYVACSYINHGTGIRMYEVSGGKTEVLAESYDYPLSPTKSWQIGIRMRATRTQCLVSNTIILNATDSSISSHGSVGISAGTTVEDFKVNSL